jgi:glucosamine 6-phosphate synthetase-like amidotransferase/phosphosugar isomerase protein
MYEFDEIKDPIQFCLNVISKEVKQDNKLVKQVLLTLLSTYTRNPINLAINAPTGEGKSYVVSKVAELFPQSDVIFLTAMTDKALFHRQGTLVVKNQETGKYEPIEDKIEEIDSDIEDKESEISTAKDNNLKQGLRSQIKELSKQKRELLKGVMKRIDLNLKVLIFADTPKHTINFGSVILRSIS